MGSGGIYFLVMYFYVWSELKTGPIPSKSSNVMSFSEAFVIMDLYIHRSRGACPKVQMTIPNGNYITIKYVIYINISLPPNHHI